MQSGAWSVELARHMPRLMKGEKVRKIALALLGKPEAGGFTRIDLAESHGQVEDWGLALSDGSRLHLRVYPNGLADLHRDALDPGRGSMWGVAHWFTESGAGRFVGVAGVVLLLGGIVWKATR